MPSSGTTRAACWAFCYSVNLCGVVRSTVHQEGCENEARLQPCWEDDVEPSERWADEWEEESEMLDLFKLELGSKMRLIRQSERNESMTGDL